MTCPLPVNLIHNKDMMLWAKNMNYHTISKLKTSLNWTSFQLRIAAMKEHEKTNDNISLEALNKFIGYYESNFKQIDDKYKKNVQRFMIEDVEFSKLITILKIRK